MILNFDEIMPGLNDKIQDDIHKKYGSHVGLLKDEYRVFFDPNPEKDDWDVQVKAGKVVHILVKTAPGNKDYDSRLSLALKNHRPSFREFLYKARENKPNTWEGLNVKYGTLEGESRTEDGTYKEGQEKKPTVNSFSRTTMWTLRLTDKRSKKVVEVCIRNGDVFTAEEIAIKQLYGDRWEE